MAKLSRKKRSGFILVLVIIAVVLLTPFVCRVVFYPKEYTEYVERYSERFGLEESFVYAVINVESGFDESASSHVGATGLMQIMEDAFKWTRRSLDVDDKDLEYSDMLNPEYNIEYGCCMLGYYYEKYGDYGLAAAAYHAGTNQVDIWLRDGDITADGFDPDDIPSSATSHYVKKVMRCYNAYDALY